MGRKTVSLIIVGLLLAGLEFSLVLGATQKNTGTTSAEPQIKVGIVVKAGEVSVVFKDANLTEMIKNNCTSYADFVMKKVFGNVNPAVTFEDCQILSSGGVAFNFKVKDKFIQKFNNSLVQSAIPLAGNFPITIIRSYTVSENGAKYLYLYTGNYTEYVGYYIPSITYTIIKKYDKKNTVFIILSNNGKGAVIFNNDFGAKNIVIKGNVKTAHDGEDTTYYGEINEISINKNAMEYFIYDPTCYYIFKDKKTGYIFAEKKKCGDHQPVVNIAYYEGSGKIFIENKNVRNLLIEFSVLLTIVGVLLVFVVKNVEIHKGENSE